MTCLSKFIYGNRVPTTQMKRIGDLISAISVKMVDQSSEYLQTAGLSVMEDIRNGVYEKPIKLYDIKHFLKYSANYKSTSCYKNQVQRESKEKSVNALRNLLLQYYDENGSLKERYESSDISVPQTSRQGSLAPLPEASIYSDGSDTSSVVLDPFVLDKDKLKAKLDLIKQVSDASSLCTKETRDGVNIFHKILLDFNYFESVCADSQLNDLEKITKIDKRYGTVYHQANIRTISHNISMMIREISGMEDVNITPAWIKKRFHSDSPCLEARTMVFFEMTDEIIIESKVNKKISALNNIGVYYSVYTNQYPDADKFDAVNFYSWAIDQDAFVGAKVHNDEEITTDVIFDYIINDHLCINEFSQESIDRLKEIFEPMDTYL